MYLWTKNTKIKFWCLRGLPVILRKLPSKLWLHSCNHPPGDNEEVQHKATLCISIRSLDRSVDCKTGYEKALEMYGVSPADNLPNQKLSLRKWFGKYSFYVRHGHLMLSIKVHSLSLPLILLSLECRGSKYSRLFRFTSTACKWKTKLIKPSWTIFFVFKLTEHTSRVQCRVVIFIGTTMISTSWKFAPFHRRRVLPPIDTIWNTVVSAAKKLLFSISMDHK